MGINLGATLGFFAIGGGLILLLGLEVCPVHRYRRSHRVLNTFLPGPVILR